MSGDSTSPPLVLRIDAYMKTAVAVETLYRVRVVCGRHQEAVIRSIFMRHINSQPHMVLQGVATQPGHRDVLGINADATQVRFTPAANKTFSLSIARIVGGQARALSIDGVGGAPGQDVDITVAPELNLVRVGNHGVAPPM